MEHTKYWSPVLLSVTNVFLGGIICWAMIPLVAIKTIKEIKQEKDDYKETPRLQDNLDPKEDLCIDFKYYVQN